MASWESWGSPRYQCWYQKNRDCDIQGFVATQEWGRSMELGGDSVSLFVSVTVFGEFRRCNDGRCRMRFWITKNSELPLRDQLVRQVLLGILSEDLPAGQKLPSVRALARRHRIHANTVSAAYHDLLEQGWLELRHGSGLYVCPPREVEGQGKLDGLLVAVLKAARTEGHEPRRGPSKAGTSRAAADL